MFGKNIKSNYIFSIFLLIIMLLFVISAVLIVSIPRQYEEYSLNYVDDVKDEVGNALSSEKVSFEITKLKNEYSFDTMIFNEGVLTYTSNDLLYSIDYANAIYPDGYVYRGTYMVDDSLVWIIVYNNDLSKFVNQTLIKNLLLFVVQALLMIALLVIMLRKTLKPLTRLAQIIHVLKNDSSLETDEKLDEISEELVKVSNDLKLKLYYTKQEEKEYERMYLKQVDLLKEQKQHLSHIVHDVKGTFSAINFSSQSILNIKALDELERLALNSIETSSSAALEYITSSLNQIINDEVDIYIAKDELEVKQTIEEFFKFNNMLLIERSLNVNIKGNEQNIFINVLKFEQVINNILSNMIKHSKANTELKIEIQNDKCTFTNYVGDGTKEYSNSFGLNSIKELTKSIGLKYEYSQKNNQAISILHLGVDKDA